MIEKLYNNIKVMRICSVIETISFILAAILICGLFYSFIGKELLLTVVFSICLFVVSLIFALTIIKRKASKPDYLCYQIRVECLSVDAIVDSFSAEQVTEQGFVSFSAYDGVDIRLMILKCGCYSGESSKKLREAVNRRINSKYGVNEKQSYPLNKLRINLYVYDRGLTYDSQKMYAIDKRLLDRVEPIFNFYIDMEKEMLFIPTIYGDYTFGQMKMYVCAVDYILQKLNKKDGCK